VVEAEDGAGVGNMAKRPEAFVGKTFVVAAILLVGKPDATQGVSGAIGRNLETVKSVYNGAVRAAGTIGNPGAVAGLEDRFEGCNEAAGRDDGLDGVAFFLEDVHVGFAVGNEEERLGAYFVGQADAKALGCPNGRLGFAELRFLLSGGAGGVQSVRQVLHLRMNFVK